MSLNPLMDLGAGETIQVRRYRKELGRDDYNRPIAGLGPPEDIDGVGVDPTRSADANEGMTQKARVDLLILVPPLHRFSSRDEFIVRGEKYVMEGVPEYLTNFFTGLNFRTEIWLKRSNG